MKPVYPATWIPVREDGRPFDFSTSAGRWIDLGWAWSTDPEASTGIPWFRPTDTTEGP